jgi:hypothetical protein
MPDNYRDSARREIREANYVARHAGWRIALWVIAFVALAGAITGGIWAVKVATSDVKGAGDQARIVNDGQNRVNAQEWFHGQYNEIKATDKNLDNLRAEVDAAATAEDKAFARTNLTGTQNRCNQMVSAYNAETQKVSRGKWLDTTLPFAIDGSDPATDCKPSAVPTPAAS